MASISIHQDQENLRPEIHNKQMPNGAGGRKRAVLGVLNSNVLKNNLNNKPKQAFGTKNVSDKENGCKEVRKREIESTVSVSQFEAFKVYEDEERIARIDAKLRQMSTDSVYKGTADDRFLTKTEVAEMRRKQEEEERRNPKEYEGLDTCPVTVKKTLDDCMTLAQDVISKKGKKQDLFFEMDEYREEIFNYLRERELHNRAKAGYMKKQPDVTSNMRTILVDWLVEVAEEYKLQNETLYLAVNFIDRFLSYMSVVRAKLQLVGTAAMFLASKYEEIFPPDVSEFVYITDDTYNKRQVIRMEHLILKVLGFDLSIPTPLTFIHAICVHCRFTEKLMYLSMYLSELSMLNGEMYLEFLPSMIASSAVALARHTLGEPAWTEPLQQFTGYKLHDLAKCIDFLQMMFKGAPFNNQHAIQDKYKQKKYLAVSALKPNSKQIFTH